MAILATEKILTLDYWKSAYQVQPGDYVFDRKGNIVKVTVVQEFRSEHCYEVMLDDYLTISGNDKMELLCETVKYRLRSLAYKGKREFKRPLKPFSVGQLLEMPLKNSANTSLYSIPTCDPIKPPTQPLSIPPFIFGFWFFNRLRENNMVCIRDHFEDFQSLFMDYGYKAEKTFSPHLRYRRFTFTPSVESQLKPNIPYLIPLNYLMASDEQRLELLKGIIKSKYSRYNLKENMFRFSHSNLNLFKQVQFLVESLGNRTRVNYNKRTNLYTLFFKSYQKLVDHQKEDRIRVHPGRRYIMEFIQQPPQSCVHIETDGPDGTFLVGEGFIACR